jgi:hypothetical protein
VARRSERGSAGFEGNEAMPALAAGGIKLEGQTTASRQTAELTKQFVARHGASMTVDATGVKSVPCDVAERCP